ncbi:MAG: glycosyltransferase [Haliscomenobacter sp.]|nr:glycosyltransferase [Haliscomenobacter sp.]
MAQLYQQAVAVLYPTLYEGFGFPALEAQAVGTPVLFSALGSLIELIGPSAEILPPENLDAWVKLASDYSTSVVNPTCVYLIRMLENGHSSFPGKSAYPAFGAI